MLEPTRDVVSCKGCTEKFNGCHSNCPKDARGEKGYGYWKKELDRINAERKKYNDRRNVRNYGKDRKYGK